MSWFRLILVLPFFLSGCGFGVHSAVGIFTDVFAMARCVGWSAHYLEQLDGNRIIRPLGEYVGPDQRDYVPIEKR